MPVIAELPVKDPRQYAAAFPKFSQPKEIAHFSRDTTRAVRHDRSSLATYRAPALPAALDVGFETYAPKAAARDEPAPLGDVVGALAHARQPVAAGTIVTFRNNLNKIFLTPYNPRDDWEVGIEVRPDGALHLHVRDTARKLAEEAARDERQERHGYADNLEAVLDAGDRPAGAHGVLGVQV